MIVRTCDVCVIGSGPAGLAAATILGIAGLNVVVCGDRSQRGVRRVPGETLSPLALGPMFTLGIDVAAQEYALNEIVGFESTWGTNAQQRRSSLLSSHGFGFVLDRNKFEECLATRALYYGVHLSPERVIRIERQIKQWSIQTVSDVSHTKVNITIHAENIIYANGLSQSSVYPPGRRIAMDRLIGCIATIPLQETPFDSVVRVDALINGWVYSVCTDNYRVVALFTDGDLLSSRGRLAVTGHVIDAVRSAPTLVVAVPESAMATMQLIRIVPAMTTFRKVAHGDGWSACGDAAQTFDPLSSLGITYALLDGIEAAQAILGMRKQDSQSWHLRDEKRKQRFFEYLRTRLNYYRIENRWTALPFWQRRHQTKSLIYR